MLQVQRLTDLWAERRQQFLLDGRRVRRVCPLCTVPSTVSSLPYFNICYILFTSGSIGVDPGYFAEFSITYEASLYGNGLHNYRNTYRDTYTYIAQFMRSFCSKLLRFEYEDCYNKTVFHSLEETIYLPSGCVKRPRPIWQHPLVTLLTPAISTGWAFQILFILYP